MPLFLTQKDGGEHKRYLPTEEDRIGGLLNVVVFLAIAAVAYTDWIVVANISLGYLYVLPLALSALVNPLPLTIALAVGCNLLQDFFGPPHESLHLRLTHDSIMLTGFLLVSLLVWLIARQRNRLTAEVRRQRDEYEHDLILAAQVQQQVLPKPILLPDLDLAATMHTARLLGGDYYDFFHISDDIIDIVIADVSGKGVAAALLMPSLAMALRLRARELSGPAAIIKDLDGVLKQITRPATFVTMFYARFHRSTRILEYASGGHNPPLLLRPTGEVVSLDQAGPILGILDGNQFSDTTIPLEPGDILVLYTDGVTEQENPQEEEFSPDRLQQVILNKASEPAAVIIADLAEAVSTFAGPAEQSDDFTLVIMKVT